MKRAIILMLFLSIAGYLQAALVPVEKARETARNVYFERASSITAPSYEGIGYSSETVISENGIPALYVFNVNQQRGYVIVSAESEVYPILAYSKKGSYQAGQMAPAFEWWMDLYRSWVVAAREGNLTANQETIEAWDRYSVRPDNTAKVTTVGPLLTTKWDQGGYYNDDCPGGSVTGCVATMMAQVMKYWNHPAQGEGYHSYTHQTQGFLEADFGSATYNWDNMPDVVSAPNADVAKLMFHCGVAVEMNYSPSGSGANMGMAASAYMSYFKYSYFGRHINYSSYTDALWRVQLRSNIIDGRPISYAGGSHAFICDGFEYPDHFHFNFGWGGSSDGYFYIASIGPGGSYSGSNQQVILDVYPKEPTVSDAQSTLQGSEANIDNASIYSVQGLEGAIAMYPNPANDMVSVRIQSSWAGQINYFITDISGRLVASGAREKSKSPETWDLNLDHLQEGVYTVTLRSESESVNQKLVIQ